MLQGGVGQKPKRIGGCKHKHTHTHTSHTHTHVTHHTHTHAHAHTHTPQQLTEIVYKQVRGDRLVACLTGG